MTLNDQDRRNRVLLALHETGLDLGSQLDRPELLARIIALAAELLNANAGSALYLYNAEQNMLQVEEAVGSLSDCVGNTLSPGEGVGGRVFATGKAIIVEDYQHWEGRSPKYEGEPYSAILGVPLRWRDQVIGVLNVHADRKSRTFNEEDIWLAELFAAQAALAINNARLFIRTQKSLNLNETLSQTSQALTTANNFEALLEAFVTPLARQQPVNAVLYSLEFDQTGSPQLAISIAKVVQEDGMFPHPLGEKCPVKPALVTIILENPAEIQILTDITPSNPLIDEATAQFMWEAGMQCLAIIPLVTHGKQWVGYILMSWRQPYKFSSDDCQLYRLLAPQMAALVENRHLLEESRQARKRFADIAMSTQDWLWEVDAEGYFAYSSERVAEVLGYSSEEIARLRWHDVLTSTTPDLESELPRLIKAGKPFNGVTGWLQHKEGNLVYLEVSGKPIFDPCGELIGYRGVGRDITHQRHIEQRELLAYEVGQRLSGVLSVAQLMHEVATQVREVLGFCHVHIRLFDSETNQLTIMAGTGEAGQRMEEIRDSISLDSEPSLIAHAARTLTPIVSNDVRNDPHFLRGTFLPETRSEVALPLFRGRRLLGVLDVQATEVGRFGEAEVRNLQGLAVQVSIAIDNAYLFQALEQQAEHLEELVQERTAEIIQERERLNAIVENAGEGIIFTGPSGKIDYINPAWVDLTGFSVQEATGSRVTQLFKDVQPPEQIRSLLRAVQKKEHWHGELRIQRPDGAEYDAGLSVAPVLDTNGKLVNLVGVIRDVSAQKQIERMRSKFVANVSHELRTPITNLKIYQTLIRSGSPEKREAYFDTLAKELGRLERLVEGLLDLSRLDRGWTETHPELIDLNDLIMDVLQAHLPRAEERSLQIETDLAADLPPIFVDRELIMQVLINLLANAINFTSVGDQIGIRTRPIEDAGTPRVMFEVWDTGVGIAPQDLPYIFNRFFRGETSKTANVPGTGLGLSITKEIIDLHRGQIKVESKLNKGSRFIVHLPKGGRRE